MKITTAIPAVRCGYINIKGLVKMAANLQTIFSNKLTWMKSIPFWFHWMNFVSRGYINNKIIASGNGLAPNMRQSINTLRPRQNGRHFSDDILKSIFLNENVWTSLKISLKFVPEVRINNIPPFVQIMAWRRSGGKPLSEPMMVSLLTHICVTRPQWVNWTN